MSGGTVAGSPQLLRRDAQQLSRCIAAASRAEQQLAAQWAACRAACRTEALPDGEALLLRSAAHTRGCDGLVTLLHAQAAALARADRGHVGRPRPATSAPVLRPAVAGPSAALTTQLLVQLALSPRGQAVVHSSATELSRVSRDWAWQISLAQFSGGLQIADALGDTPLPPLTVMLLSAGPISNGLIGVTLLSLNSAAARPDAPPLVRLEQQLWHSVFANVDAHTARQIAAELEDGYRRLCRELALGPRRRPADDPPPTAETIFPPELRRALDEQRFVVSPAALQAGPQAPISSYFGEEVRLLRLDEQRYLLAVNGLNLQTMQSAPNGLVAVLDTAAGADAVAQNAYYQQIRATLLANLGQLPPGSELHLSGHSMGGGIVMLLSHDPLVTAALHEHDITLASLVTIGAVRPEGAWGEPAPQITGPVIHYVDFDDRLAREVGAGHVAGRDDVVLFAHPGTDGAVAAHTNYAALKPQQLPADQAWLPWVINPALLGLLPLLPPPAPARRKPQRRQHRTEHRR